MCLLVGTSLVISPSASVIFYGIFFKYYEILCISKQCFSSKPKGELTQPVSETTVPIFWSSLLQKDKYTTKCKTSKISKLNNETFKEKKKKDIPFKKTLKSCTNRSVQIFMILLMFVQNIVYWTKGLSSTKYWFLAVNSDTFNIFLSPWNFNINRKVWKSRHMYRFKVRKIS